MPDSEEDELIEELVRAWVEVYKKSATTLILLRSIGDEGPVTTSAIADTLSLRTGWELTERGLYRTLRRLSDLGLVAVHEQPGHRTGARRHVYELTARGQAYLQRVESALIT
ncbi:MAG: helix-turn-helix transcriptional regulator [Ornithinimicrobium sp.]